MHSKLLILLIVGIVLMTASLGWFGYQSFKTGFNAKAEPHMLEVFIARQLRHLAIPVGQRTTTNAVPLSPEVLADARARFADHCATCHANDGKGKTSIGQNVYPKLPELRFRDAQSMSDGEIISAITMEYAPPTCLRLEKENQKRISIV